MDFLKFLEYLAVFGSIVGSIPAIVFGKILYTAPPMSLALFLNLINRQRLEQQLQQSLRTHETQIADVQTVVQKVNDQVQAQSAESEELNSITEVLTELQRVTKSLEKDVLRHQDWEVMNVRFKLMVEEAIANLKASAEFKQHSEVGSAVSPEASPPGLALIAPDMDSVNHPTDDSLTLLELQGRLEQLHHQVMELDRQNRELVKPYLLRLVQAVKQLQT
ncbi:MAG: hypothetical protein HC835_16090 [Oscillatoriales cyanobacterium RM2_1_1]|nr:hypothetical protein [Oscillatoriales cyanobacterium SM2_3_0]NJO47012.1 hypothetical protein [Oscillatoriales cyanobacterium RM2_1_1]